MQAVFDHSAIIEKEFSAGRLELRSSDSHGSRGNHSTMATCSENLYLCYCENSIHNLSLSDYHHLIHHQWHSSRDANMILELLTLNSLLLIFPDFFE